MNDDLLRRINTLNPAEPWVWRLRLSENDFEEIKSAVMGSVAEHGGSHTHLLTQEWAKIVIAYMAEWYKRRYAAGNTDDGLNLNSEELKAIWEASGFGKKLVYKDSSGNCRWQYSTYVLGGFAIRHELGRNDNSRFLKAVCRIYHKEKYTLENIASEERAVSFRASIEREHSLHHYLRAILNGDMPFSESETADPISEVSQFVEAIKRANDEVMHDKFRLEWIVTNNPENTVMRRRLRLWLKPEEVGAGLRQYLRFDRVLLWGMKNPMQEKQLEIAVRFVDGNYIVGEANWKEPLIRYVNTGCMETGFLSVGVSDYAVCRDIPAKHFTKIEILLHNTNGDERIIQEEEVNDFMQLWRRSEYDYEWSSIQDAQKETALLFGKPWRAVLEAQSETITAKPFKSENGTLSDEWRLRHIYDKATITDGDKEMTFYNRQGYYKIMTRLYTETIRYVDGGYVWHTYSGEEDGLEDELLPLIFGKDDVVVRHFGTKDDIANEIVSYEISPEMVEYKDNGRFVEWNEANQPHYGKVALRVTSRGRQEVVRMCHLPRFNAATPIERDFAKEEIHYLSYDDKNRTEAKTLECKVKRNHKPLNPTKTLRFGVWDDIIKVDVWKPTLVKELCIGETVVKYVDDNEVVIPYILKQELSVNDFSKNGFVTYQCKNLGSIYSLLGEMANAHFDAWAKGKKFDATALDPSAPESLKIVFGDSSNAETKGLHFYKWDYDKDGKPITADYSDEPEKNTLIFQSFETLNKNLTLVYPKANFFAFGYKKVTQRMSYVNCFETAIRHRLYFFMLEPFTKLRKKDIIAELYNPLLKKRNGTLTDSDKAGLMRFAEEMGFVWKDLGIII